MRPCFAPRHIAGGYSDVGHPLERFPNMRGIIANLNQRKCSHGIAEQFDLAEQAFIPVTQRTGAFLPEVFVSKFVRDDPAQFGLAGDEHQLRCDDQGGPTVDERSWLLRAQHIDRQLAVTIVISEHGLESRFEPLDPIACDDR